METVINPSVLKVFQGVRLVIWDFDDTLYERPANDMESAHAILRVLRSRHVDQRRLSDAEFYELYERDYRSGRLDTYIEENFGISYAQMQLLTAAAHDLKTIIPFDGLSSMFETSSQKHIINTHACRAWIKRNLAHLQLDRFFSDEDIICHIEHGGAKKSDSPRTYEVALERAGVAPHEAAMVDDRAENLIIPKSMGMRTVLITPQFSGTLPDYVDMLIQRPMEVFDVLRQSQSQTGAILQPQPAPSRPDIAGAVHQLRPR